MQRRYVTLSDELSRLAIGNYILERAAVEQDEETGEIEMLLIITDTMVNGPDNSKARYIRPRQRVEIDSEVSFHFIVGTRRQLRGVIDAPTHLPLRRLPPTDRTTRRPPR